MKRIIVLLSLALILAGCENPNLKTMQSSDYTIINATGRIFPCITVGEDTYSNIPVDGTVTGTAYGLSGSHVSIDASIWEDASGSLYMDDVGILEISDYRSYTITLVIVAPSVDTNAWRYGINIILD